jgi:hypothetical protein
VTDQLSNWRSPALLLLAAFQWRELYGELFHHNLPESQLLWWKMDGFTRGQDRFLGFGPQFHGSNNFLQLVRFENRDQGLALGKVIFFLDRIRPSLSHDQFMDKESFGTGNPDRKICEVDDQRRLEKNVQKRQWGSSDIQSGDWNVIGVPIPFSLNQEFNFEPLSAVFPQAGCIVNDGDISQIFKKAFHVDRLRGAQGDKINGKIDVEGFQGVPDIENRLIKWEYPAPCEEGMREKAYLVERSEKCMDLFWKYTGFMNL